MARSIERTQNFDEALFQVKQGSPLLLHSSTSTHATQLLFYWALRNSWSSTISSSMKLRGENGTSLRSASRRATEGAHTHTHVSNLKVIVIFGLLNENAELQSWDRWSSLESRYSSEYTISASLHWKQWKHDTQSTWKTKNTSPQAATCCHGGCLFVFSLGLQKYVYHFSRWPRCVGYNSHQSTAPPNADRYSEYYLENGEVWENSLWSLR